MTLQQYADAINVDMLSGKKINDLFNPLLQELAKTNPAFEGIQLTETPQEPTPQTRVVTPLGQCLIEWKGWKDSDSYSVTIGNEYVGEGHELDESKLLAKYFLVRKKDELSLLLGQ